MALTKPKQNTITNQYGRRQSLSKGNREKRKITDKTGNERGMLIIKEYYIQLCAKECEKDN